MNLRDFKVITGLVVLERMPFIYNTGMLKWPYILEGE